ncbi:MAG: patatin-like phospholipase family protein [Gemmatimonadales bacterium]
MAARPIEPRYDPKSPVGIISETERHAPPSPGLSLCLSGGGYRAMLFHLGALWRLHELGTLPNLRRVSSVSGGSIVAAQLALRWRAAVGTTGIAGFQSEVVTPIRRLAGTSIDWKAVLLGMIGAGSVSDRVAGYYRKHLYGDATLQDLPSDSEGPRFVINASNTQSGALWRFAKPYMADYRVGQVVHPTLSLATAVAASSAFPPVLSPCTLHLDQADYTPGSGEDLQHEPFTTRVVLTDGGVYDNLGLETAWKRYRTILVADGGGQMSADPRPSRDWLRHTKRVLDLVDNQVRALRKRQVISAYELPRNEGDIAWRDGAYWGIRTNIADYGLPDPLPCPHVQTMALASVSTRLAKLPDVIQERLINWGYAVCDAAMRRWVLPQAPGPSRFPYPAVAVG